MLDDARLVHRDVKPENILFRNGSPCLSDISLLDGDLTNRSRSGTYGYGAPGWYLEAGGHPDMYGAAATLYVLLTGKSPNKMPQSRHRWPPQGEDSLPESERREWQSIHRFIARATDDDSAKRFVSFSEFDRTLNPNNPEQVPESVLMEIRRLENELEIVRVELKKQRDEFGKFSEFTMKALEDASFRKSAQLAGSGKTLAAVAERFEEGLTAAKSRTHWIKALDLTKHALQTLKTARDACGNEIGLGFEELRSGIERILKSDREFRVGRVREVLARALSLSISGIGSSGAQNASAKLAGLLGGRQFQRGFSLAGMIAPAVPPEAATALKDAVASILKIIHSAQGFLEDQKSELPGLAERSAND